MQTKELKRAALPGGVVLVVLLGTMAIVGANFVTAVNHPLSWVSIAGALFGVLAFIGLFGFISIGPNESRVLQLFGAYVGTVATPGLRWVNPFYSKSRLSLRVNTFDSAPLKVNDLDGNPIEIACIVVWRVVDSARALFDVGDVAGYMRTQAEATLRNMATSYPYDAHEAHQVSLRGSTQIIAEHLKTELQEKAALAGVQILEARISHLAYSPEIAHAMLQRQQAGAIIAARQKIVEGAVGMVEHALQMLSHNKVVVLDEQRKAEMVSNLLVVLCGQHSVQPVINTSK